VPCTTLSAVTPGMMLDLPLEVQKGAKGREEAVTAIS
jgi:hypothetical protein